MGLECHICGKMLSTEAILKRHVDTVHCVHGTQSYSCEHCDGKLSRNNYYDRHLKEVHGFQIRLNLDFARKEFHYPHKCGECSKRFLRKESLERHMNTTHTSEREMFPCKFCEKMFNRRDTMKRHMNNCKLKP